MTFLIRSLPLPRVAALVEGEEAIEHLSATLSDFPVVTRPLGARKRGDPQRNLLGKLDQLVHERLEIDRARHPRP